MESRSSAVGVVGCPKGRFKGSGNFLRVCKDALSKLGLKRSMCDCVSLQRTGAEVN